MPTFDLPIPPSVNEYWRTFRGRIIVSEVGRAYRHAVRMRLAIDGVAGNLVPAPVAVLVRLHSPDRRRRDLDNLGKALLDSLKAAGVYEDDSVIDDLRIVRGELDRLKPRVTVTVETVHSQSLQCV